MKNKDINRRDFLKSGACAAIGAVFVTSCADVILASSQVFAAIPEVVVDKDKVIIDLSSLKESKAANFILSGKKCILLYNDGEVRAFENKCTHVGGPTKLKNGKLVCKWHGSTFDPLTGQALTGPAPLGSKLQDISIKIEDGKVILV